MKEINFSAGDYADCISQLTDGLGYNPSGSLLDLGYGKLFIDVLEEGLFIYCWEFEPGEEMIFSKQPQKNTAAQNYRVAYLSGKGGFSFLERDKPPLHFPDSRKGDIALFSSENTTYRLRLSANRRLSGIALSFTRSWLMLHYKQAGLASLSNLLAEIDSQLLIRTMDHQDKVSTDDIWTRLYNGTWDRIFLRSRLMQLLWRILYEDGGILQQGTTITENQDKPIYETAKRLMEALKGKPPSLNTLSQQAAMSESTLKRHFANVFGKSITAFYQEKKMELAKDLLMQDKYSVNQVAYMLSYEKPSPFIKLFRKLHGHTPGELKKQLKTKETGKK